MAGCKPRTFGVVGSHSSVPQPVQQLRQKTFDFSFWNWVVNSILMRDFNQYRCTLVPQKLFLDKSAIILFHQMMKISLKHLAKWNGNFFLKKWANPGLFLFIFGLFKQKLQIFTSNICEKCPSSIWYRDLNPRPSEHDSPPITTRPGLPPILFISEEIK